MPAGWRVSFPQGPPKGVPSGVPAGTERRAMDGEERGGEMSVLKVEGLRAGIPGREILNGIDLEVHSGRVHAVMGPNGSGKSTLSHVLMGNPEYAVLGGSVTIDGFELLGSPTWKRAEAGLFLAMQYPTEVPGVSLSEMLEEAFAAAGRDRAEVRELVIA